MHFCQVSNYMEDIAFLLGDNKIKSCFRYFRLCKKLHKNSVRQLKKAEKLCFFGSFLSGIEDLNSIIFMMDK